MSMDVKLTENKSKKKVGISKLVLQKSLHFIVMDSMGDPRAKAVRLLSRRTGAVSF